MTWLLALLSLVCMVGCVSDDAATMGLPVARTGREISVCGQLFHVGSRVVLWNDPYGYDAYRGHRHFDPDVAGPSQKPERIIRFDSWRRQIPGPVEKRVQQRGWTLEDLREVVHQVVLHYDAAGSSAQCFRILHDVRGLSSHFMIDLDGTIYQTLDLKERAWHAGTANDSSIGIEIANIGAYSEPGPLAPHYERVDDRTVIRVPFENRGHLSPDGTYSPARPLPVQGEIHGQELQQYDFTDEQYAALIRLLDTLSQVFPKIERDAPRDSDGQVRTDVIPDHPTEFAGIVGHYHLTPDKVDPGPAFDWARVLGGLAGPNPAPAP